MSIAGKAFAWIAVLMHTLFFCLESLFWAHPKVIAIFKQSPENVEITKLLAYNQGFYNLFLAIGLAAGLILLQRGKDVVGKTLVTYICLVMIGAALVLLCSAPTMIRGALGQGIPPILALTFLTLANRK